MDFGSITSSNPNQVVADTAREFRERYKYRILGKQDAVFEDIARSLPGADKSLFDSLKSKRTRSMREAKTIGLSGYDANAEKEKLALNRLKFVKDALKLVFDNRQESSSKPMAKALRALSRELDTALDEYVASKGGAENVSASDSTIIDIRNMHRKLERLEEFDKIRLRQDSQFFNRDHFRAGKRLEEIQNTLDLIV